MRKVTVTRGRITAMQCSKSVTESRESSVGPWGADVGWATRD